MTVGSYLQTIRKEKNLSLQDVSFALKISPKILAAIEENNPAEMPAKAFVKGFVKSYAKLLKISSTDFDLLFVAEFGESTIKKNLIPETPKNNVLIEPTRRTIQSEPQAQEEVTRPAPATTAQEIKPASKLASLSTPANSSDDLSALNKKSSQKTFVYVGLGIALIVLIAITQRVVEKYQRESTIATPTQEITPIEKEAIPSEVSTEAKPTESTPVVEAAPEKPATEEKAVVSSETPGKEDSAKVPAPAGAFKLSEVEVIIEATGNVEIQYSSKTSLIGKLNLTKGQVHIFKSKNGLQLSVTDGGLIKTAVNGQDKGVPGQNGKPLTITY